MIFKGKVRLRPVMVWLYGGGYMSGHCNSSLYGPDFFMEEDVVLVTFNYRLSVLGIIITNDISSFEINFLCFYAFLCLI